MLEMANLLKQESAKHDMDNLKTDTILFYGISKMVEIIGEAAYMITNDFKDTHTELPWRQMSGMRHMLVHGYYTVRPEVLWDVIQNDIPAMIPILEKYLAEL